MLIAQINPTAADLENNLNKIHNAAEQCPQAKKELLVLPAYALTGWPLGDLAHSKTFMAKVHKMLPRLYHNDRPVLTAIPDGAGGATPVLVTQKGVQYGDRFTIDGQNVAVSVAFEPVNVEGADRLIVLDAKPYRTGGATETLEHARTFASRIRLPVVYTNLVGASDSYVFAGGSFMLDIDGGFIECLPLWDEGVAGTDDVRFPWTDEPENTWRALVTGMRNYVFKNGFKRVVLGLSGGMDSALTAAIAVDALGADKVFAVMMPSVYTSQESLKDARDAANLLGIRYDEIPIIEQAEVFTKVMNPCLNNNLSGTTAENLQARLRAVILMTISNHYGDLLLNTCNKSEDAVGYATLYGDTCGGFAPLRDLYKSDAYKLAKWRCENHPAWIQNDIKKIIPDNIFTKAPTAELRPNQKDSDSLPEYDVLDAILKMFIEGDAGQDEAIAAGFDENTVRKVFRLLHLSEYKRRQGANGIKISRRSFDTDWNYPITKKV